MAAITLPAALTMADARATLQTLREAMQADAAPVLDAAALRTLDTAAVAVLLECRRIAAAAGKPLQVKGAPPRLRELAQLYGVDGLLALA